jgi:predicted transcriptional regulator of viral defense system
VTGDEPTEWRDLAEIARAVPSSVVALISALAFHQIGTAMAYEHWIAIPEGSWEPQGYEGLRTTRFAEPYYSAGVEEHVIEGVPVKIYSPAKTVADCFKMRSKIGFDVAIEALRDGWRQRRFSMDEIQHFAKLNRVEKVMHPYIEAITN